ncbi:hypothetical protein A3H83_02605 [Candidatus Roizmanbacteria bacterium RIFCSPLOWO2_02_FULL_39_8]|nr:MAG: hypothetical protein A3H83_02605 [Candidatus Roizmanbacteria bacterium RIFCSPLOWO2_02_FULL_39_8]
MAMEREHMRAIEAHREDGNEIGAQFLEGTLKTFLAAKEGGLVKDLPWEEQVVYVSTTEPVLSPEQREEALVHQFETRVASLAETGITEHSFVKRYPIPTREQFVNILRSEQNQELAERKTAQGFSRLDLTPFAAPTTHLLKKTEAIVIIARSKANTLLLSKRDENEADHPAAVNTTDPIWIWDGIRGVLTKQGLRYFPERFTDDHGGRTRKTILTDPRICAVPGWSIRFDEPTVILPQPHQAQTVGGRTQLATNATPRDYLTTLSGPMYAGETGRTIEDFLTDFAVHLHETGQVSYEWNQQSAVWLIGNVDPQTGSVPYGFWYRGSRQLELSAGSPGSQFGLWGTAPTVRLIGV